MAGNARECAETDPIWSLWTGYSSNGRVYGATAFPNETPRVGFRTNRRADDVLYGYKRRFLCGVRVGVMPQTSMVRAADSSPRGRVKKSTPVVFLSTSHRLRSRRHRVVVICFFVRFIAFRPYGENANRTYDARRRRFDGISDVVSRNRRLQRRATDRSEKARSEF